jgi:hypothetical protein
MDIRALVLKITRLDISGPASSLNESRQKTDQTVVADTSKRSQQRTGQEMSRIYQHPSRTTTNTRKSIGWRNTQTKPRCKTELAIRQRERRRRKSKKPSTRRRSETSREGRRRDTGAREAILQPNKYGLLNRPKNRALKERGRRRKTKPGPKSNGILRKRRGRRKRSQNPTERLRLRSRAHLTHQKSQPIQIQTTAPSPHGPCGHREWKREEKKPQRKRTRRGRERGEESEEGEERGEESNGEERDEEEAQAEETDRWS